jgi:hypothetical protein
LIGWALLDSSISPFALSAASIAIAFFVYTKITEHRSHSIGH